MAFAVFLLVGPAPEEIDRLSDLFDAIASYEPDRIGECDLYIANDGNKNLKQLSTDIKAFRSAKVFKNPGHGVSPHVWDRHINGSFEALKRISNADAYQFLLKLDTDALVVAPFYDRIHAFFSRYPKAGVIGTHLHFPSGELRPGNFTMTQHIQQCTAAIPAPDLVAQVGKTSYQQRVADTLTERQTLITAARHNGHFGSQHVQGGGYAVSSGLLKELKQRNWPACVDMFNGTGIGEDVATAILTKASGYELMDCNHPDEPFGVWFQELRLSLDDIVDRNYAVIHSIKDFGQQRESLIRQFFQSRRKQRSIP